MRCVTLPSGKLQRALLAAGAFVVVLVVVAGFLYATGAFRQDPEALLRRQGGYRIVLQARCPPSLTDCDVGTLLPTLSDVLSSRIGDGLHSAGAQVRQQGSSQLVVYLPGLADSTNAVKLLTEPGVVQFIDTSGQHLDIGASVAGETCAAGTACDAGHFPIVFDNSEIDPTSVTARRDPQSGQPIVTFAFLGTARDRFAQYTQSHILEYLTITLDNAVIESAVIQSKIDGLGQIGPGPTGSLGSMADAQRLAAYLKDGALPLAVSAESVTHVSPGGK